ncbi:MAG: hypothetical protein IPP14_03545 [Planctomycetes bacterium]|nr:hypothetical protein [Planctomycetota bacterium]
MTSQRTQQADWPLDTRQLLSPNHQRAAWRAMVDARDMLADIALTMKLLSATAFAGQEAARSLSVALNTALLEAECEMGAQGVICFQAKQ